jgi:hypothetical protein
MIDSNVGMPLSIFNLIGKRTIYQLSEIFIYLKYTIYSRIR